MLRCRSPTGFALLCNLLLRSSSVSFFFFFSFIDLIRLVFSIASSTPTHYDRFLRQRPFLFTFFFFLRFIVVHDFFPTV